MLGAFSAVAFYGVGQYATTIGANEIARAGMHALAGGVIESLQGGNFGHGFVSAGFSKLTMSNIDTGSVFADVVIAAVAGGVISEMTGGKFANGATTAAMQFAFNALTQKAAQPLRTVTVRKGYVLTEEDRENIVGINKALAVYGHAVYASGDIEAINDYRTATLTYDPDLIDKYNLKAPDGVTAPSRAGGNRITFGRDKTWRVALVGSGSYYNAEFSAMSGDSYRAWAIAHEFGHLHSSYSPVFGSTSLTEGRANNFAKMMQPFSNSQPPLNISVSYGN